MMISDGMNNMLAGEWWVSVFPGLALFSHGGVLACVQRRHISQSGTTDIHV